MPGWSREELELLLSERLVEEKLSRVMDELQAMQAGHALLQLSHPEELLQGDVYEGVPCVSRTGDDLAIASRRVMLVSNSCDADQNNARHIPIDLTVAPVLRLSRYRDMLVDNGVPHDATETVIRSIKQQEKTNLVYLPAGAGLQEEMVALLDQVQSLRYVDFISQGAARMAVLTQRGYWLFLLKLSMHFLRPHEGVERDA